MLGHNDVVVVQSLSHVWLQHARLHCPSPSPGACSNSNSCPLSRWCYLTISTAVIPFSCLLSFPASLSFPLSQLLTSGAQNIGSLVLVFPVNIQGWFPSGLTGLISLLSKGLSRVTMKTLMNFYQNVIRAKRYSNLVLLGTGRETAANYVYRKFSQRKQPLDWGQERKDLHM